MHISKIDYPDFYGDALGDPSGAADFVRCVDQISGVSPSKIVVHQAARLTWLADRMRECASGRPALQTLFFLIAAEAVGKLVAGFEEEGESKGHVRLFFEEICSTRSKETLSEAFSRVGPSSNFVALREAVDFLYQIRCDVAHRGNYFNYSLKEEEDVPMLIPCGAGFLFAHVTANQLREIVLEGSLLGARRLLPHDSKCQDLLKIK